MKFTLSWLNEHIRLNKSEIQISELLTNLGLEVESLDSTNENFKNFLDSQKFVNSIGKISEDEGHHPDITFGWGYAKVNITTHAIEGLSENDFILAAKIDKETSA